MLYGYGRSYFFATDELAKLIVHSFRLSLCAIHSLVCLVEKRHDNINPHTILLGLWRKIVRYLQMNRIRTENSIDGLLTMLPRT